MKFNGFLKNGWFELDSLESVRLEKYCRENERIRVAIDISKIINKRSSQANRFYWGVVLKAFNEINGLNAMSNHTILKSHFLTFLRPQNEIDVITENKIKAGGKIKESDILNVKSTTDLSTKEFVEYLKECTNLLFEYGGSYDDNDGREFKKLLTFL